MKSEGQEPIPDRRHDHEAAVSQGLEHGRSWRDISRERLKGATPSWRRWILGEKQARRRAHANTCRACAVKAERESWWPRGTKETTSAGVDGVLDSPNLSDVLPDTKKSPSPGQTVKSVEVLAETDQDQFDHRLQGWQDAVLSVSGMTCSSCVGAIERAFKDSPAIRRGEVTLMDSAARVTFNSEVMGVEDVLELVRDAGYDAELASIQPSVSQPSDDHVVSMSDASSSSSTAKQMYRVLFSVTGMTCASCSSTVARALSTPRAVADFHLLQDSINVDTMGASAECLLTARNDTEASTLATQIKDTIEDTGFDAELVRVSPVETKDEQQKKPSSNWTATFSIEGMTCQSCVRKISKAINDNGRYDSVRINLERATGKVALRADSRDEAEGAANDLYSIIKSTGFAIAGRLDVKTTVDPKEPSPRVVRIKIDGMYCEECVAVVNSSLQNLQAKGAFKSTKFSVDHPVVTVSYIPAPPNFTIRTFLDALEEVHFAPRLLKEASIEERAKRIHARERCILVVRFLVALLFSIPTFIIAIVGMIFLHESNHFRVWLDTTVFGGVSRATFALFLLATPVQFGVGWVFYERSYKSLRGTFRSKSSKRGQALDWSKLISWGNMDLLVAIGTTVAYFSSLALMIIAAVDPQSDADSDMTSFDTSIFLQMFILLGRVLESVSKEKTGDSVSMLGQMKPDYALLIPPQSEDDHFDLTQASKISSDYIEIGDCVLIPAGSMPPTDGVVIEGESAFDESSLTGESRPVQKATGDEVHTGTQNLRGPIVIQVTSEPGASTVDKIAKIVQHAQGRKAPIEKLAEKITGYFVPFIVYLALLAFLIWTILGYGGALPEDYMDDSVSTGGWVFFALQFAISVVVVACPCGIGLAAPTAQMVGTGMAASHGILANGGGEAFEMATKIDCVAFDKTGTLTSGNMQVTDWQHVGTNSEDESLAALSAIEYGSTHPIAIAIQSFCSDKLGSEAVKTQIISSEEIPGQGLKALAQIADRKLKIIVGNERLIRSHLPKNAPFPHEATLEMWKAEAKSVVIMASAIGTTSEYSVDCLVAIADPPRPEAEKVIEYLRNRGIDVYMITGDNHATAKAIARMIDLDEANVISEVMPDEKAAKVKWLQSQSRPTKKNFHRYVEMLTGRPKESASMKRKTVAFVGDGINDAPALAQADTALAMGSGSQIAVHSADFILISSTLLAIPKVLSIAKVVNRRIRLNFGWAMVYNCALVPIAAGVFYPLGHTRLPPVWSALAMSLSSVSVVLSSLALRIHIPPSLQ